jgi:hypothetical protein
MQYTPNYQFSFTRHIINRVAPRKSNPQSFAKLIAFGARLGKVTEDLRIIVIFLIKRVAMASDASAAT